MNHMKISAKVLEKINKKHHVSRQEVENCFINRSGRLLQDTREQHLTDPPTLWFLSYTNAFRLLKIVYIQIGSDIILKSAFEPNATEISIYTKHGNAD